MLHANGNDMKVGVGNTHIRQKSLKKVKKYKEGHYITIKKSLQEEDITLVNIYVGILKIYFLRKL